MENRHFEQRKKIKEHVLHKPISGNNIVPINEYKGNLESATIIYQICQGIEVLDEEDYNRKREYLIKNNMVCLTDNRRYKRIGYELTLDKFGKSIWQVLPYKMWEDIDKYEDREGYIQHNNISVLCE
jgi:hypothetical protein